MIGRLLGSSSCRCSRAGVHICSVSSAAGGRPRLANVEDHQYETLGIAEIHDNVDKLKKTSNTQK